jgi:Tol biopolymer transport system component
MRNFHICALAGVATAIAAFPGRVSAAPGDISLISVRLPGQTTSMYGSYGARISADGRIVGFFSTSPDLVPSLTNGYINLFARNLQTGTIAVVRINSSVSPFSTSDSFSISADGRYLAFTSAASSVVPGDSNGVGDVFVRDMQTGTTDIVSVSSTGAQARKQSTAPSISADGRYVAFSSLSANLAPGDSNNVNDVFVHDRQTGKTERVSVSTAGVQGNGASFAPATSADGRYVAFTSYATNLVAGDSNGAGDVFVHDRQTGQTERVSVSTAGVQGNGANFAPAISADGRYVAFSSDASNLVPGDTNGATDTFVRDLQAGTTERANVASGGGQTTGGVGSPTISANGRFVAFTSIATNLVPGDTNDAQDVFVHDRLIGQTMLASLSSAGVRANGASGGNSLSADGRYVAFDGYASNLVSGDRNSASDVFVRDRQASTLILASSNEVKSTAAGSLVSLDESGCFEDVGGPSISADGRYVAFPSTAPNLVAGQEPLPARNSLGPLPFVRDRQTGKTAQVAPSVDYQVSASHIAISADASTIAIWGGDCSDDAIIDRVTGVIDYDVAIYSAAAWSANGQLAAYTFGPPVLVMDRRTRQIETVSVNSSGVQGNGDSDDPAVSADGRYVAFLSNSTDLVAGDTNGAWDVFVRDRQARTTERVSVDSSGQQANHGALYHGALYQTFWQSVSISADGRYVAFESDSTNLVPGDFNGFADVFVRDRQTRQTERVSIDSNGVGANADSSRPMLSPDGRYVVFHSTATNLVPNYEGKYFIRDRLTGVTAGLLTDPKTQNAIAPNTDPSMSADQRLVAFASNDSLVSTDLNQSAMAPGIGVHADISLAQDVYLQERGVSTSALTVSPKTLVFGNHAIGTVSAAQPVTVTNTTATSVPITGIALAGANPGQFGFTHTCGSALAGNAKCTVKVTFKPTSKGAKSAVLNVNGGGGGLRSVALTGTGN